MRFETGARPDCARALDPVDVRVGSRIRARRRLLGVNQEALAKALGLSAAQLHKYETGINRVSASRLWQMAVTLETPIASFFDDRDPPLGAGTDNGSPMDAQAIKLIRSYRAIADQRVQAQFFNLVKLVATSRGHRAARDE